MRILSKYVPENFQLYLLGCTHHGTTLCYEKGIEEAIKIIASKKNNYAIHLGDWVEGKTLDNPHYDARTTTGYVSEQVKDAIATWWPVRKKMLCGLKGNHELALRGYGEVAKDICDGLGIEYGTWSCKFGFFGSESNLMFKVFATHGSWPISSKLPDPVRAEANKCLSVKGRLAPLHGDCLVMAMAHCHQLLALQPPKTLYLTDNGREIKQNYTDYRRFCGKQEGEIPRDYRFYCAVGSFRKVYTESDAMVEDYAERAGYPPAEMGMIELVVRKGIPVEMNRIVL